MPIATNRFFVESGGNDANDGRDLLGLTLVNATYDHTGNGEGERHLLSAGAFSGYTFASGDKIYLLNAVGGVAVGLYEVASKVDADAILLSADSGLTADSTTDVDSSDGPWATLQKAADTCTSGQDAFLSNAASEAITVAVDFDTQSGTSGAKIRYIGCDSAGDILTSGHFTVDGSGLGASTPGLKFNTTQHQEFMRIRVTTCTGFGFDWNPSDTNGNTLIRECRTDTNGLGGVRCRGNVQVFVDCEIDTNTGRGIESDSANRGRFSLFFCRVHDNTSDGVYYQAGPATAFMPVGVFGSEIYDNGGNGILLTTNGDYISLLDNTIYINDGDGIDITSGLIEAVIRGNSMAANGAYGLKLNSTEASQRYIDYNHFYNNTSGHTDAVSDANINIGTIGYNNQTGDPQFAVVTDGSEDFTPANGSPLDSTDLFGVDIGARKAADPAGGGGVPGNIGGGMQ